MKYICTVADIEELLKEVVALEEHMPMKSRCQSLRERMTGTNAVYAVSCDAQGRQELKMLNKQPTEQLQEIVTV